MSKIEYNNKSRVPCDKHAMVLINAKYGTFTLNDMAVKLLGVRAGDGLVVCVDMHDGAEWSLLQKDDGMGCKLRRVRGNSLMFSNKAAGKGMYAALNKGEMMRFKILEKQDDGSYPLLTRVNLYKSQKSNKV